VTQAMELGRSSLETGESCPEPRGNKRAFGEPVFFTFMSTPLSHWVHLDAPPPGPHASLIAVRLAGVDPLSFNR
jgi:hypothetical protein